MNATKVKQRALEIKNLIVLSGRSHMDISTALRVDKRSFSQCLSINPKTGDFVLKDPYIREGIARYLGLPFREVWDEEVRYPETKMRRSAFFRDSKQLA